MNLPQLFGHYVRVGLATFFTCVAAWETLQNGFLATHVLLWWLTAAMFVVAAVIEGVRIRRRERDSREETR